jgi:hypothetical protein
MRLIKQEAVDKAANKTHPASPSNRWAFRQGVQFAEKELSKLNIQEFPNGFTNWYETFYEIVTAISAYKDKSEIISSAQMNDGTPGLYLLAKCLTDKFEILHKGKIWGLSDGIEYFDAIEDFIKIEFKV